MRNEERVADHDRAKEDVIEKMIHVEAPLAQAGVAILADFAVEVIGKVVKYDHQIRQPKPAKVTDSQVIKHDDADRPDESKQR